jgi:ribosomal protein S18 acetylase RimI-like enzyme
VVLIRPGAPADATGIVAVLRASWPVAYAGILPPGAIDRGLADADPDRERAAFTTRPWRRVLVAEALPAERPAGPPPGGTRLGPAADPAVAPVPTVVGFAAYGIQRSVDGLPRQPGAGRAPGPAPRPLLAELYSLYVAPDWWSTGTGRALMDRVLAGARAEGYPRIILWVLRDNRRARRFYERAGFRRKGAEHPSFAGVPEVRYVRDLLKG